MGMSAGGGRGGMKSDINVTPLVDVVLVLLIIFMVVTPMMKRGQDVVLPKASRAEEEQQGATPLFLSVTADRKLYVEADPYPDEAAFVARLREELRREPGRKLVLKADQTLSYGDVGRVVRRVREAGGTQVAFGVETAERP